MTQRIRPSRAAWLVLALPLAALAVSWPQQTSSSNRTPAKTTSRQVDNQAEPFDVTLTNQNGQLGIDLRNRVVEWDDLHGRRYRAEIRVEKVKRR